MKILRNEKIKKKTNALILSAKQSSIVQFAHNTQTQTQTLHTTHIISAGFSLILYYRRTCKLTECVRALSRSPYLFTYIICLCLIQFFLSILEVLWFFLSQ